MRPGAASISLELSVGIASPGARGRYHPARVRLDGMETEIDSYHPAAQAEAAASQAGDEVVVGPRSVTVLRATSRLR